MIKELEIWKFAVEKLKQNENLLLLVVVESSGSSPGRQGFKMVVSRNEMRGSVGGGVMETELVQSAKCKVQSLKNKSKLRTQISKLIEQVHRKNAPNASGMICSGKQTVISFALTESDLETVEKIIAAVEENQKKTLQISNSEFQVLDSSISENFKFESSGGEFLYAEKLGYKNKLFIIGGGHCALALSDLMSKMDFHISLFDDRADLNTIEKNSFAHGKKIIESYEQIGEFIESGANHYVVVMTLGYKFDEIVIRKLLEKDFKYFGVLGSKAKMKTLLRNLEKENFDKDKLTQIRTPIGLKINSQTPEEIAVSIAAEIISVKNKSS